MLIFPLFQKSNMWKLKLLNVYIFLKSFPVRKAQFEQAAGAVRVDVNDVVLQPLVHRGLDARKQRRRDRVVLGIAERRGFEEKAHGR